MKITVNGTRYDLGSMAALGVSSPEHHGIEIRECYFGRRSHRLIVETYSIWQGRDGCCVGTEYTVYNPRDPEWVDRMQFALDNCDPEHDADLEAALDKHVPALRD